MRSKKRGRPATGQGTPIQVRIQRPMLKALDQWIKANPTAPSRPAAIRALLSEGLSAWRPKQASKSLERE
jgi:hypothetical protein